MNLASGSVTKGGSIPLNLSLTAGSGGSPAALQWTLAYPATDIASFSVAAGSALTSAGKTLTCTSSAGVANCVASGMNATAIGSGVVAVVTATTAAGAPDSSAAIAVTNAVGAYPGATLDTTAATGGTITLLSSAVPVITSSTSASGTVGSAFSYQIAATNSPTSYAATSLPAGLSVNTSTGLISGTPTAAGTSSIALSATNSSGTGNATLTLTVTVGPPVITSSTSASGTVGSAFSYQITATNSPTSYAATSLPAGLSVNTSTGLISGTPTAAGTSSVALSATNGSGAGHATLTLTVTVGPPVITSSTSASGTVGSAFSYQITATNSPTSYAATSLPPGLSVNTATGLVSGTPTAAGTSSVALSATNSSGTGHATLTLTVTVGAPVITSSTSAAGTVGSAFSYQITATNSPTSYAATSLPAGLAVNTSTGLISGTPTAAGTSSVALSATNAAGTGHATLTLTVTAGPPVITSSGAANGIVGSAFSYQIAATNSPTSYAATSLPAGLAVNAATGLISGTPTAAGTSSVALSATNSAGTGHATLTLTVTVGPPVITSSTSAAGTVGSAFSYQITATNSPTSYAATSLPAGLSVNTSTGLISGTPTAAGTSSVALSATNSAGTGHATLTLTVTVGAPVITSSTSAAGTVGSAFSYQITATNSPTSYATTSLPAGLSVNTSTGLISGTPTAAGTSSVALSATNSAGTGHATLTLTVTVGPPVITSSPTASGIVGSAFSYQITATNFPSTYAASSLPAGLTVNTSTGLISGVPVAAGTSSVTLSATNGNGTGQATLTLTITPASTTTLSLSSGSVTKGNSVSLNLSLAVSGSAPAGMQWTLSYPTTDVTSVTVAAGSALTSAAKTLTCASQTGSVSCVASGMNANPVSSGVVAVVTVTTASGAIDSSVSLPLSNVFGVYPGATADSISGIGGITTLSNSKPSVVTASASPALSGASAQTATAVTDLSCTPKIIPAGRHAVCALRVAPAAETASIVLTSSSQQVRAPATVTTRPNQSRLSFQVFADAAAKGQLATITAASGAASVEETIQLEGSSRPVLVAPSAHSAVAGKALHFAVTAVDPSDLPVQLTASRVPAGASFDASTGLFAWIPSASQTGSYKVAFAAANALGQSSAAEVTVNIGDGSPRLASAQSLACSPGAPASLNGSGLAAAGETKVTINGQPATVLAASDAKVSFLCPDLPAGTPLTAAVATDAGVSAPLSAAMQPATPTILTPEDAASNQALITFDGASDLAMARNFRLPAHPAQPGETSDVGQRHRRHGARRNRQRHRGCLVRRSGPGLPRHLHHSRARAGTRRIRRRRARSPPGHHARWKAVRQQPGRHGGGTGQPVVIFRCVQACPGARRWPSASARGRLPRSESIRDGTAPPRSAVRGGGSP